MMNTTCQISQQHGLWVRETSMASVLPAYPTSIRGDFNQTKGPGIK